MLDTHIILEAKEDYNLRFTIRKLNSTNKIQNMKKLISILAVILLLTLLASGVVADAINFFAWLFILENTLPEIPLGAEIAVRVLSFFVSYGLVGLIFSFLSLFNKRIMSLVYAVISTLVFVLGTYIIWFLEKYIIAIVIVLSIVLVIAIIIATLAIVYHFKRDRKNDSDD